MSEGAVNLILQSLSNEEYHTIPDNVREKIETCINEHLQNLLTSRAIFETTRKSNDDKIQSLTEQIKLLEQEKEQVNSDVTSLKDELAEVQLNLEATKNENEKLEETIKKLESESLEYRRQRDLALDERNEALEMVERRNNEVRRLQEDLATLGSQLQAAVQSKCEALANADEVDSLKLSLEYKEKRLDQERALLNQQIHSLTEDLAKHTEDMTAMRREHTNNLLTLHNQLSEKTEELKIANSANSQLTETNKTLNQKVESLTQKLIGQCDIESKMNDSYREEIKAQTKLAELHKGISEELTAKNQELTDAVLELQRELREATEQYGELEAKLKERDVALEVTTEKKNLCIQELKKELEHANQLMEAVKQQSLEKAVESLSPAAAATSRLLKSGLTLTQLYMQYAETAEQLMLEKQENQRLNHTITTIMHEIEQKAPVLKKQREDYDYAMSTVETLTSRMDEMEVETSRLRAANLEAEKVSTHFKRENKRLQETIGDLGRQVCYLLKEVEESRGNNVAMNTSPGRVSENLSTSSQVISKHLVTFRDIQEMQVQNQKLLSALRELSEKQEQAEQDKESQVVEQLEGKLRLAEQRVASLLQTETHYIKMVDIIKGQREMYRTLFQQQVAGLPHTKIEELEKSLESDTASMPGTPENKSSTAKAIASPALQLKLDMMEQKLKDKMEELKQLQEEFNTYKKEKQTNEKMVSESLDKAREEAHALAVSKSEIAARLEFAEEKFKVLKANADAYKAQIQALEKKNNNYSVTIGKHEQSITYLKDECITATKKLAQAEITLENLKREHQILKESEARLQQEKELTERQTNNQALLMANLEMIKNSFERTETEGRLRLESKLEEAQKECSALRRRLQEEQDRFRERTDALERAAATARSRLDEEKEVALGLRAALESTRLELRQTKEAVDQLSNKVRTTEHKVVPDPNTEKRASQLEQQLAEKDGELVCLREQLEAARKHGQELSDLASTLEKQLAEVTAAHDKHRGEADTQLKAMSAREAEMKKTLADLESRVSCLSAAAQQDGCQAELSSATAQLASLSVEVASLRQELIVSRQACQAAEDKYSHEMMLHAEDMQAMSKVKKELLDVSGRVETLEAEREAAVEALRLGKEGWASAEAALQAQVSELNSRLTDLDKQNSLLHEQLQELGLKVAVVSSTSSQANTSLDTSMEDDMRSSDQLLQVLKYMRREKNIAVAQADALRAETLRLRSQVELQSRQLMEARQMLDTERSQSQLSTTTATKHEELLRKVDTLNALTDSNRVLREERDRLVERAAKLEKQLAAVDTDVVAPYKEQLAKLNNQVDQLATENTALKAEAARWRSRANALIEKQNKNSPEDFKRLTLEKENLTKQLAALTEELKNTKSEKSKVEEQLMNVRKEKEALSEQLAAAQKGVTQARAELTEVRAEQEKKAEELAKVSQDLASQEAVITDVRNKEMQIRQIAKKYKTQYQDLVKRNEEEEKKKKEVHVMSVEEQNKLREEGRQEAERTQAERLKQLTDQVTAAQTEATSLRQEVEQLRTANADKEERAKVLLKNARSRIMFLTEEKRKLSVENTELQQKVDTLDRNKDDSDVRQRRADKEKADLISENERLKREVDLQMQRVTLLQRQVDKLQGGVKPSTSSGVEKSSVEPPTANIKPMAGPSSSGTKQQPTQHSVTVTPWRGGTSETPFASIRPMSLQSRTVAVLPTTNQSSSSQAVLVPPQQQMVHTSTGSSGGAGIGSVEGLSSSPTSSHTDYMPATSSGVVVIRQATVPPTHSHTQHAPPPPSSAAESTQDVEAEDSIQPAGTANPQAIALVLPQPTAQTSSQTTQTQCLQGSGQDSSVGSQQEQSAEQNIVSASNHVPSDQGLVSASSNQQTMCSTVQAYYRNQQEVEESGQPGSSATEQSVVASSEAQLEEASNSQEQCPPQAVASSYANSSNTVTTSQAGPGSKRLRDSSSVQEDDSKKNMPPAKRNRVVASGEGEMLLRSDGLEVEYQVPTSSQRDQEDDVILVDSDEEEDDEGLPDDGVSDPGLDDNQEFEEEGENEEVYEIEVYSRDDQEMANYDVGEGPDIDENITDQGNNEVEIIDDSNEVPNQSESSVGVEVGGEATSSQGQGRGEASVSSNQASSTPGSHYVRRVSATHIPPLNRQQQLLLPGSYEEVGDDSIVPSTPTLFVPRRTDGFGEAVSSPHVPSSGRFTFSDNNPPTTRAGVAQVASEGMDDTRMDLSQLEDTSTGRSVPSTPLQVSPQEPVGGEVGQSSSTEDHTEANNNLHIPTITVTTAPQHSHPTPGPAEMEDVSAEGRNADEQDNEGVEGLDEPEMDPEEGGDGVSSEGEKSSAAAMVEEAEEGREAEASEASATVVARGPTARRSMRPGTVRGRTPIVWNNDDPPTSDRGVSPMFLRGRNIPLTRSTLLDQVRGQFRGRARRNRTPFHFQPRF
ncbi:nucleoprotein TPR-like isoform X3 [Macrosteles quadrilineatus]|uniref:nucleoprotein TPR-like isoform X3 n=1 Tax=Macrosteles quadrilineatus TaxID=74068 RepID=UPI0023E2D10F|nr:nucleoprotein TPR-like isoform X3 [Macrosteles quadrilineatus]